MKTEKIKDVIVVKSEDIIIKDVQPALDFVMSIQYEWNSRKIVLNKEAIDEQFFDLSTKLAGEILQKFINYQIKCAIYGDYSKYTSLALKNFIYESNCGKDIFFVETKELAIDRLKKL